MRKRRSDRVALDLRGLTDRVAIFRVHGGVARDPAVGIWLGTVPDALRDIARHWVDALRACGDDVRELLHDGGPVACIEDAPFAGVNAFTRHVNVSFFYGAMLDDPAHLLVGSGKRMRHVKLTPDGNVDSGALRDLIRAACRDIRARLDAERTSEDT